MASNRFDRQLRFFGAEGQARVEKSVVGIVGLGGLGSHVVQDLAYMGVQNYVLIDDDPVDETNLNRLIGAVIADSKNATPKVEVANRVIVSLHSGAVVTPIKNDLRTRLALDSLKSCSTIFGCVDNDAARLILSEFSASYCIPLIDLATEIILHGGKMAEFGGRVVVARPGDYCLSCAGEIDMKQAKWELDSPSAQEIRREHGYGLGGQNPSAAVVSINGVVANLALTEFLMMVTGLREPNLYLRYIGERGMVNIRTPNRNPDCYTCKYLVGKGDKADIYKYVIPSK